MEVSSTQNLYPVVQDLTDAEYGGNCCCADIEFGNFSLKDLVMPAVSPRPLPNISPISSPSHSRGKSLGLLRPPPAVSPLLSSAASASASPKSKSKSHRRSNTLGILKLGAATTESYLFKGHCRSYSSPSTIISETGDSTTVTCEAEERVTDSVKFDEVYVLTRQIFRCNLSTIWECIHRENGLRYCVKMIDRRRFLSQSDEDSALREIAMLSSLNDYASPHVVSMVQVLEDSNHFYIISEIVDGGNLLTLLNQQQEQHHALSEQQVKDLARSLLLGVQALHALNISHHDLQPENLLLLDNKRVQICDFGSAVYVDGDYCCKGRYGNMQYAAPEVLRGKTHGSSSDLWSVGVILYYCLCGHLPFEDPSKRRLKEKIVKAEYDFSQREWAFVSRPAKQFISNLLHADSQVRLTASEALKHTWLASTYLPLLVSKRRRRETMVQRIWGKLKRKSSRNRAQTEDASTTACTASPTSSLNSSLAPSLTSEESSKRKLSLQRKPTM